MMPDPTYTIEHWISNPDSDQAGAHASFEAAFNASADLVERPGIKRIGVLARASNGRAFWVRMGLTQNAVRAGAGETLMRLEIGANLRHLLARTEAN